MKIEISSKAQCYLKDKQKKVILITIKTQQEGCLFAVEPRIVISKNIDKKIDNFSKIMKSNLTIYIDPEIGSYFPSEETISIDIKGKLKKKLSCVNINPLIIRKCKPK